MTNWIQYTLLLILVITFQNGISQHIFNTSYSYTNNYRHFSFSAIQETDNNGFIYSFYDQQNPLSNFASLTITKIDSIGNIIGSNGIEEQTNDNRRTTFNSMIKLSTGQFCQVYTKGESDIRLAFFNDDLIVSKTIIISKPIFSGINSIIQGNDSTLLISGVNSDTTGVSTSFLINIDLNGNERWTKYYGNSTYFELSSLLNKKDDNLILIGTRFYTDSTVNFITEINIDGDVISKTLLNSPPLYGAYYHSIYGLSTLSRVNSPMPQPTPYYLYAIHHYNSDYTIDWSTNLYRDSNDIYFFRDMTINNLGDITLIGAYKNEFGQNIPFNAQLLQLNQQGEIIRQKTIVYDSLSHGGLGQIQNTSDDGFICLGSTSKNNYAYKWIVKMDSHGCYNPSCILSIPKQAKTLYSTLTCYPNPSNGMGSIKGSFNNANSTNKIKVFNSLGQLVFSKSIAAKEFEMEVNLPNSGLYLVNLYQGDKVVKSLKWVVQ